MFLNQMGVTPDRPKPILKSGKEEKLSEEDIRVLVEIKAIKEDSGGWSGFDDLKEYINDFHLSKQVAETLLSKEVILHEFNKRPALFSDYLEILKDYITPEIAQKLLAPEVIKIIFIFRTGDTDEFRAADLEPIIDLLIDYITPEIANRLAIPEVFNVNTYFDTCPEWSLYWWNYIEKIKRFMTPEIAQKLLDPQFILEMYSNSPEQLATFVHGLRNYMTPEIIERLLKDPIISFIIRSKSFDWIPPLNIHRKIEDMEVLAEYAKTLIEYSYNNPSQNGSLYHTIIELVATLDNRGNQERLTDSNENNINIENTSNGTRESRSLPNHPYISQQNIIQMGELIKVDKTNQNFNTGSMIASSLGFLNESSLVVDNENTYTPHPDYIAATVAGQKMFLLKDYENTVPKTIYKYDEEGNAINYMKVKPLGVDSDFYHTYYLTEDNLIIKICLDMSLTNTLLNEFQDTFSDTKHYFETSLEDKGDVETSQLESVSGVYAYLKVRYPEFNSSELQIDTWAKMMDVLQKEKDTTFAEFKKGCEAMIWNCQKQKAIQEFKQSNQDMVRLTTSKDHNNFFKVLAVLKSARVLDGDKTKNSHSSVFREHMEDIKINKQVEQSGAVYKT